MHNKPTTNETNIIKSIFNHSIKEQVSDLVLGGVYKKKEEGPTVNVPDSSISDDGTVDGAITVDMRGSASAKSAPKRQASLRKPDNVSQKDWDSLDLRRQAEWYENERKVQQRVQATQPPVTSQLTPEGEEARRQQRVRTGDHGGKVVQAGEVVSPWKGDTFRSDDSVGAGGTIRKGGILGADWGKSVPMNTSGYYTYPHPKAGLPISAEDREAIKQRTGVDLPVTTQPLPRGSNLATGEAPKQEEIKPKETKPEEKTTTPGLGELPMWESANNLSEMYYHRLAKLFEEKTEPSGAQVNQAAYGFDPRGGRNARKALASLKSGMWRGDSTTSGKIKSETKSSPVDSAFQPSWGEKLKPHVITLMSAAQDHKIELSKEEAVNPGSKDHQRLLSMYPKDHDVHKASQAVGEIMRTRANA